MKTLATILLAGICLVSCKKETGETDATDNTTGQETAQNVTEKYCYLKVYPFSPEYNKDRVVNDSIVLEYEKRGDSIFGMLNFINYEKDKKYSTFKGTMKDGEAVVIANSMAEGMDFTEEVKFNANGSKATIITGALKQGDDGIWHYEEGTKTSEQTLDKVDCK